MLHSTVSQHKQQNKQHNGQCIWLPPVLLFVCCLFVCCLLLACLIACLLACLWFVRYLLACFHGLLSVCCLLLDTTSCMIFTHVSYDLGCCRNSLLTSLSLSDNPRLRQDWHEFGKTSSTHAGDDSSGSSLHHRPRGFGTPRDPWGDSLW